MNRVSRSQLDRRQFKAATLTELVTSVGGICRVCLQPIAFGELCRFRGWGLERAHDGCGWFRADELPNLPRLHRVPGAFREFWEWQCPECKLDATAAVASTRTPPVVTTCGRCRRPRVNEWARTKVGLTWNGVRIPQGTQCLVMTIVEDRAIVAFTTAQVPVQVGSIERTPNGERQAKAP